MPLYCYAIEEIIDDYEKNLYIVAHRNKYTPEEFYNLCLNICKLYGHPTSDTTDEGMFIKVSAEWLIHILKIEHYFIVLDIPFFDCTQHVKVQGPKPGPEHVKILGKWVTLDLPEDKRCGECCHYDYDIYVGSDYMESIVDERCRVGHSFLDAKDCPDYQERE